VQEEAGEITYWHVELPSHAVILAEGLACESYLDTGNRRGFANGGQVVDLHPNLDPRATAERIWQERGCAPLIRDGEALVAVRTQLHRRLAYLGFCETDDPDLHLLANGIPIRPSMVQGRMHRFLLPAGTMRVTVSSISGVPAEHDPVSIDRRRLGVMITAMVLRAPGRRLDLSHEATRCGFHPPEWEGARQWQWTDGAGEIALPDGFAETSCLLDLHIAAVRPAWRKRQAAKRVATTGLHGHLSAHA
jgi:hypothetical protein